MNLEDFIKNRKIKIENSNIGDKTITLDLPEKSNISVRCYSRLILQYSSRGTKYGSNEEIYKDIIKELKMNLSDIKEIHLSLYLFNNKFLYDELVKLAKNGIKIIVTTIPLSGYDNRKIDSAKDIYNRSLKENLIDIRIYPYMYIWHGARYAGGGASYSFHVKAGMIKYKKSIYKIFLTSGNLAPGDPTHTETAIFIESDSNSPYIKIFENFFSEIENRAKKLVDYNEIQQEKLHNKSIVIKKALDFSFIGKINKKKIKGNDTKFAIFTTPFYWINSKGSNHYARERIVEIISAANKKIHLCAQHIHDIAPFDNYNESTIIKALRDKKEKNKELDIKVLKQVTSSSLADKRRAAFTEAHLYYAGIPQKINKLIHDKFVVADDTVLITTSNFTSTQFAFGERRMEYLADSDNQNDVDEIIKLASEFYKLEVESTSLLEKYVTRPRKVTTKPKIKIYKKDIFSEINGFIIIKNKEIANHFTNYFNQLWNHALTKNIIIPI